MIGYKYVWFDAKPDLRDLWKRYFLQILDIYWLKKCRSGLRELWKLLFFPSYISTGQKKCGSESRRYPDKKENQIFLIYREIQSGAVAKSYMRKGFLTAPLLIYEENLIFFFISVRYPSTLPGNCPPHSRPPFSAWAAAGADSSAAWAAWAAAAASYPAPYSADAEEPWAAPPTPGLCPVGDGGPAPGRGGRTWGSSTSPEVEAPAAQGERFLIFLKEKMGWAGKERLCTALRIRIRQLKWTPGSDLSVDKKWTD